MSIGIERKRIRITCSTFLIILILLVLVNIPNYLEAENETDFIIDKLITGENTTQGSNETVIFTQSDNAQDTIRMTIDEIAEYLSKTWYENNSLVKQIFGKTEINAEFRNKLVNSLKQRYETETTGVRIANLTRTFLTLDTPEMLPEFQKKWDTTGKFIQGSDNIEPRIQLLIAISRYLPESESVDFLIKIESDTTESLRTRFRAAVMLCATGNKKAIEHVLSIYEKAKKDFPDTMGIKDVSLNKTQNDSDGDSLPDDIEKGLLFDPDNPDTDGDGLLDGNDRNPLCKTFEGKLSDDQQITQLIFYLYAKYSGNIRSPYNFNLFVVRNIDNHLSSSIKSLFTNLTFTGINGVVIHLNNQDYLKFSDMHGKAATIINLHKFWEEIDGIKKFNIKQMGGRSFDMSFKKFDGTWVPIELELIMGFGDAPNI